MVLNTDIILSYPLWSRADNELNTVKSIFNRLIDIFVVACAIGIQADKTITEFDNSSETKTIARNTINSLTNQDLGDILTFLLQTAILTTKTIDLSVEERIKLAFDPDFNIPKFSPAAFLSGFANYGIQQIYENIDSSGSAILTAEQICAFLRKLEIPNYEETIDKITLDSINS